MAKTLQEKNQMECNKRARAKYQSTYNQKMGLKQLAAKFKLEEIKEIEDYCKDNKTNKTELFRTAVLGLIRGELKSEK